MSLKKTAWWTTIACLSVLLSTVGSAAGKMSKTSASSTIVITMNPQGYTPIVPTKDNPHPSTMLGTLAKQYEALHPNVQIQFLPSALVNTLSNPGPFITRANAGDAPDVAWAQENMVNSGEYPQGLFIDLRPYLRRPDPYIRGNKHWIDAFNPAVIAEVTAPSGAIYVDSAEYIAAGMMYNKAAFAKARITAAPHTFADLLSDEVKLQKAGYWPTGCGLSSGDIDDAASWWEREAMSSFFQEQLSAFNANHTTYETNGLDYAVAVKKGLFRMTNPRYAEVWKLLKTWSQHWEPDPTQYAVMPPSGLNASATWLLTPFLQNKLARLRLRPTRCRARAEA